MESPFKINSDESSENLQIERKYINCVVNGIFMNQNNTLMTAATNFGYKIFEAFNFLQVSEDDDIQEIIGDLKLAVPFYETNIVMFVGKADNPTFPSTQLVFWNDARQMKLGVIILKENIVDAKMSKEVIFILLPNKILVYNTKSLEYIMTIADVDGPRTEKVSVTDGINPVVMMHVPQTRQNQLKLVSVKGNYQVSGKASFVLSTPFDQIAKFNIYKKGSIAIVAGSPNNKIHIYSLVDFQLKFCLDSQFKNLKICNISISKKAKFFSILYQDFNLEVYNLIEEKKVNKQCECIKQLLSETEADEGSHEVLSRNLVRVESKKGIFSKAAARLKNYFFEKNRLSFAKYRFDPGLFKGDNFVDQLNLTFDLSPPGEDRTIVLFERVNELVRFALMFISS